MSLAPSLTTITTKFMSMLILTYYDCSIVFSTFLEECKKTTSILIHPKDFLPIVTSHIRRKLRTQITNLQICQNCRSVRHFRHEFYHVWIYQWRVLLLFFSHRWLSALIWGCRRWIWRVVASLVGFVVACEYITPRIILLLLLSRLAATRGILPSSWRLFIYYVDQRIMLLQSRLYQRIHFYVV